MIFKKPKRLMQAEDTTGPGSKQPLTEGVRKTLADATVTAFLSSKYPNAVKAANEMIAARIASSCKIYSYVEVSVDGQIKTGQRIEGVARTTDVVIFGFFYQKEELVRSLAEGLRKINPNIKIVLLLPSFYDTNSQKDGSATNFADLAVMQSIVSDQVKKADFAGQIEDLLRK